MNSTLLFPPDPAVAAPVTVAGAVSPDTLIAKLAQACETALLDLEELHDIVKEELADGETEEDRPACDCEVCEETLPMLREVTAIARAYFEGKGLR